jgi:hypothetical protein
MIFRVAENCTRAITFATRATRRRPTEWQKSVIFWARIPSDEDGQSLGSESLEDKNCDRGANHWVKHCSSIAAWSYDLAVAVWRPSADQSDQIWLGNKQHRNEAQYCMDAAIWKLARAIHWVKHCSSIAAWSYGMALAVWRPSADQSDQIWLGNKQHWNEAQYCIGAEGKERKGAEERWSINTCLDIALVHMLYLYLPSVFYVATTH